MNRQRKVIEDDSKTLFNRWYVVPLKKLEEIPNGDGGFIVLATCCYLYERYVRAFLKSSGLRADDDNLVCKGLFHRYENCRSFLGCYPKWLSSSSNGQTKSTWATTVTPLANKR